MTKDRVREQFGAHAAAYATSVVHAKGASLARLVELVQPQPHWRALDVATGAGHTAAAVAPHIASVIASDMTPEMLDETRKLATAKGLANVTTALADAEALPFADASFDLVTCRIAPHHFGSISDFVAEVRRVLVPGGVFALVDNIAPDAAVLPGFDADELTRAAQAYNAFEKVRDPSHGRCLGMQEWVDLLTANGFGIGHWEELPKDMEFLAWAERMGADAATVAHLRVLAEQATPALRVFLRPRQEGGALWLSFHEAIFIAHKP